MRQRACGDFGGADDGACQQLDERLDAVGGGDRISVGGGETHLGEGKGGLLLCGVGAALDQPDQRRYASRLRDG